MKNPNIPTPGEQVIPQIDNLFKSIVLIGLLISSFYLAQIGADAIDTYSSSFAEPIHFVIKWSFLLFLGTVNDFILIGLAVLAHEAIHKVLFKNEFWNELWGGILSAFPLVPFYADREFHLTHHRYTHQPGYDPEEPTQNRPFWHAVSLGIFIAFHIHYKILLSNLLTNFWNKRYTGRIVKDVLFLLLAGVFYFYLVPLAGMSILYTFVPMMLTFPVIFTMRTMADHYAMPPVVKEKFKEQVLEEELEDLHRKYKNKPRIVDSWVILTNPLMDWLWSHVHYQQVHHRYPYLSHRYLPFVFEVTKDEQPYAVAPGYFRYFRSLINLKNRQYYSTPEDIKPFLISEDLAKSV